MSSTELENRIGELKRESPSPRELSGSCASAVSRLADAEIGALRFYSRFDLAYNAARALYALRRLGYRCDNRYLVFQCLPHTADVPVANWPVLAKAHKRRNLAEYEGHLEHDERLLADVIAAAKILRDVIEALPQIEKPGAASEEGRS